MRDLLLRILGAVLNVANTGTKASSKALVLFKKSQHLAVKMPDFLARLLKLIFHYSTHLGQLRNSFAHTLKPPFPVLNISAQAQLLSALGSAPLCLYLRRPFPVLNISAQAQILSALGLVITARVLKAKGHGLTPCNAGKLTGS